MISFTKTVHNKNILIFIFVVLCASLFRVSNGNLIEFKADEAINLFLASRPFFGHPFPPGSTVSSIGIMNFPLMNYILFPIILITQDPRGISLIIGLLNSLAIGFYFLLLRRYYGMTVALIASLLLAFSPWHILFSRKIWAQDFIFLFTIPLLLSIHRIIVDKNESYWFLFALIAILLAQLHLSTLFFIGLLLLSFFITRTKIHYRNVLFGIAVGIIPAIPYILFELHNGCPDCTMLTHATGGVLRNSLFSYYQPLFQVTGIGGFFQIFGNDIVPFAAKFKIVYALRQSFYLLYLLIPFGMFIFFRLKPQQRLLLSIPVVIPLLFFFIKIPPFIHYYIYTIPLLFLFLAFAVTWFLKKSLFLKIIGLSIFWCFLLSFILFNIKFFTFLSEKKGLQGDYGTIYSTNEAIVKTQTLNLVSDPNYKEIVIANYVPINYFYGYLPLAKVLYKRAETEEHLSSMNQRLIEYPNDTRIQKELLAYYSPTIPNSRHVATIRGKAQQVPAYQPIYELIYRSYLDNNYKKSFSNTAFGVAFEYPSHWKVEKENTYIYMQSDMFTIYIFTILNESVYPAKLFKEGFEYQKQNGNSEKNFFTTVTCITKNNKWCGTKIENISIGKNTYIVLYSYADSHGNLIDIPSEQLKELIKTNASVLGSMREI